MNKKNYLIQNIKTEIAKKEIKKNKIIILNYCFKKFNNKVIKLKKIQFSNKIKKKETKSLTTLNTFINKKDFFSYLKYNKKNEFILIKIQNIELKLNKNFIYFINFFNFLDLIFYIKTMSNITAFLFFKKQK